MASKKSPLYLDGILGSQLRDQQGEVLSVEGADISELEAGRGLWNDNHSSGAFNTLGRITEAKKILKEEDCENERHKYFWDKIKAPYIYGKGYLFDDEDHPNAKAAAAILRNIHKTDSPLKLKASVEGGVLARGIKDSSLLARTKITKCAITFVPANNATLLEPLNLDKSASNWEADLRLIKSVMHLAETNVPSFRHIVRDASASKVQDNLSKINELMREMGIEIDDINIPSKKEIIQKALEDKVNLNITKINKLVKLLNEQDQDELEKGLKNILGTAALTAGLATSGQPAKASGPVVGQSKTAIQQPKTTNKSSREDVYKKINDRNSILGAIGFIESSGGRNMNHQTITDPNSMSYGHTAAGTWGILPITAQFCVANNKKEYPKELIDLTKDWKNNHKQITQYMNDNPEVEAQCAEWLFDRAVKKTGSIEQAIHSWKWGVTGTNKQVKEHGAEHVENKDYVKSVLKQANSNEAERSVAQDNKIPQAPKLQKPDHQLTPPQQKQQIPQTPPLAVNKALTAGYGGASAPTSMTGGSIIQTESLEDGRKIKKDEGFKYIVCDHCGKDQIYATHQVKCRSCNKSFSLEKLYNLLVD